MKLLSIFPAMTIAVAMAASHCMAGVEFSHFRPEIHPLYVIDNQLLSINKRVDDVLRNPHWTFRVRR